MREGLMDEMRCLPLMSRSELAMDLAVVLYQTAPIKSVNSSHLSGSMSKDAKRMARAVPPCGGELPSSAWDIYGSCIMTDGKLTIRARLSHREPPRRLGHTRVPVDAELATRETEHLGVLCSICCMQGCLKVVPELGDTSGEAEGAQRRGDAERNEEQSSISVRLEWSFYE
jgi:hypothetical protein